MKKEKRIKLGLVVFSTAFLLTGFMRNAEVAHALTLERTAVNQIGIGGNHIMVISEKGDLYAWGANAYSQLGNPSTTDEPSPILSRSISNLVAVTGGSATSYGLTADGVAYSWGAGSSGQLGQNIKTDSRSTPKRIDIISNVTAIEAGGNFAFAITSGGNLYGWGYDFYGQVGNGNDNSGTNNFYRLQPQYVSTLGSGVTDVSAGNSHAVALKGGEVWTWGNNKYGALGSASSKSEEHSPVKIPSLYGIVKVEAGEFDSFAISSDGSVYAWGQNDKGQLGVGHTTNITSPAKVSGLTNVLDVEAGKGGDYALALKKDGTVWAWGNNRYGTLGNGTSNNQSLYPVQVQGLSNVVAIETAGTFAIALTQDGKLYKWGKTIDGQYLTPVEQVMPEPIIDVPDTTPPSIQLTTSTTEWSNRDITVNVSVTDDSQGAIVTKWGNGNQSIENMRTLGVDFTGSFIVSTNGSYTVYAKDEKGNESVKVIDVSNIDKILPTTPTISQENSKVLITPGSDAESGVKETLIKIDNGAWSTYSLPVSLPIGQHTVYAKTKDNAGNESGVSSQVLTGVDQALIDATTEVEKAEQQKTQEQVDKAKDLVDALPPSLEKDDLLNRLQDVQSQIDAEKALEDATNEVVKAEQEKTQEQVDKAKDLVDALPASPEKDDLLDRLQKVQDQIDAEKALQEATQKVVVAETTRKQSDIDVARDAVNALPDSASKKDLQDRLDAIIPDTGGTTPPTEENDIIPNKDLPSEIGKLTDPADKKTFSDILKAIERAEANPTNRVLIQLAWDKVKAVPDSVKNNLANKKIFNSLYKRAEKLKDDFNSGLEQESLQVAIKKATDYVVSYEKYKLAYYKAKAQEAVDALPDGEIKTNLQARIDAVVMK